MPSVSTGTELPVEFRSMPALVMAGVLSTVLLGASVFGWAMLGENIRGQFTWPQVGTLLFFIFVMIVMMMAIGLSSIVVDEEGIRIRNAVFTTRYGWDEIIGVQFGEGDPWAYLVTNRTDELDEEKSHLMLAIQRSEGPVAQQRVDQLRELVARHAG